MLASMSETDPRAEPALLNWSELGISELPTGTVTLLLADVEGSARLWETQPDEMTAAVARLDRTVADIVTANGGVRPVEQGEGDSFVVAFARASDAVTCALQLQLAPLAPIRLRIGLHTGEIQLRDDANYMGSTINRTARLRDLAHGGQTLLSGATESLVVDRLPADVWLTDLGVHPLRDLLRPERVAQLNHPDLRNRFPPLRSTNDVARSHLPAQLTSFVGRNAQINDVQQILRDNRLVTLTGAGGVGKTRLAIQVAAQAAIAFDDGVWFVDLAAITDPLVVPVVVARTLGLPDQQGRSTMDIVLRFVRDRKMLLVLDNCEHLLDASGNLVIAVLDAGRCVSVLATSREPIGVAGELTWRVPSLSLDGEAVELFVDRARRARPEFRLTEDNSAAIAEICRRLDGMPLAIELAAARIRTLSLAQIVDRLHDSFRVLAGGARTAVQRQQTLRASVDWSHAMLTEPERVLFRRLTVFMGGFDLDAAHAVGAGTDMERFQLIDLLGLLVDKSLVVAEDNGAMRYRLLETVRQYGLEKLGESGEADTVRMRHRDYYTATAAALDSQSQGDGTPLVPWAEIEIDNLRASHTWSCETAEFGPALQLVSSLQRLWETRSRFREGLAGFNAVFADKRYHDRDVPPRIWARAVADAGLLPVLINVPASLRRAQKALAAARDLHDQGLIVRTLMACGMLGIDQPALAGPYFAEAIDLARATGDRWALSHVRGYQASAGTVAGSPIYSQVAGEEGRDLADALGDGFMSRYCRAFLAMALFMQGKLADAHHILQAVVQDAQAAEDRSMETFALIGLVQTLVFQGNTAAAQAAAQAALDSAAALGGFHEDLAYVVLANAALADGDAAAAREACGAAWRHTYPMKELFIRNLSPMAEAAMGCGDLAAARQWADDTVAIVHGWHQMVALTARARVAIAQAEPDQAERDAHDALAIAAKTGGFLHLPDTLECIASLAAEANHQHAARLFGAAEGIRRQHGEVRFKAFQAAYDSSVAAVREALGVEAFDSAWAEGAALSIEESIGYAQRGRGERKRPSSGWASLTPTELDVVRLVSEGLANKDIAARLFVSPRTVQTHLTHVYTKLSLTSRVQLVQEAARHT
jgi:predicted ATPase/class 3 adenylate cyclase/DNA-binding CsgD family transcriptional regulator